MSDSASEGVVKYQAHHHPAPPPAIEECHELIAWRQIFYDLQLIGQNPDLYGGAGYGNISRKVEYQTNPVFWITGTQTGGLESVQPEHFSKVERYDLHKNFLHSSGPVAASSEAMTHGAIYEADPSINFVFHTHSSIIWNQWRSLNLMATPVDVEYGTPEMAQNVARLVNDERWNNDQAFVMLGHEDGVFSFGKSAEIAGARMVQLLAKAGGIQLQSGTESD